MKREEKNLVNRKMEEGTMRENIKRSREGLEFDNIMHIINNERKRIRRLLKLDRNNGIDQASSVIDYLYFIDQIHESEFSIDDVIYVKDYLLNDLFKGYDISRLDMSLSNVSDDVLFLYAKFRLVKYENGNRNLYNCSIDLSYDCNSITLSSVSFTDNYYRSISFFDINDLKRFLSRDRFIDLFINTEFNILNNLIYYTSRVDFDSMTLYEVRILLQSLKSINITVDDIVNASKLYGVCIVKFYKDSEDFVYYTVKNSDFIQLVKYNKITKELEV